MAWFKVDDKLWGHQKWVSAPPGARSLWVTAGSWAADHLTDGFVPTHMLGIFGARAGDSRKLVEIGLWEVVDGGWRFRDWSDYQPSRESVLSEREKARQRQHDARARAKVRAESRRDNGVTVDVTTPDVTDLSHDPDPTRPDPTLVPTELDTTRAKRGTRIPDDWRPSNELISKARTDFPSVDLRSETDAFCDWWRAKAGRDAVKLDWDLTWTTWMRRNHKENQERDQRRQQQPQRRGYGLPGERRSLV
jgi:hypothetical protein